MISKRHIQLIRAHTISKRHTVLATVCPKGTLISFSRWIPAYLRDSDRVPGEKSDNQFHDEVIEAFRTRHARHNDVYEREKPELGVRTKHLQTCA